MSFRTMIALTTALGVLVIGGAAPRAHAQPAGIEGSWVVTVPRERGEDHQLVSFLPGGVMLGTNTSSEPEEVAGGRSYTAGGHGAWASSGGGRFGFTLINNSYDGDGDYVATVTIEGAVALGADGDHFSGTVSIRVVAANGRELFAVPSLLLEGTRIRPPAGR